MSKKKLTSNKRLLFLLTNTKNVTISRILIIPPKLPKLVLHYLTG
jgi:hypothetical protein